MSRTRRSLRDSQYGSPEGTDDEDLRSPVSERGGFELTSPTSARGRKGKADDADDDVIRIKVGDRDAMDVMH